MTALTMSGDETQGARVSKAGGKPRFRLRFRAVFWRITFGVFLVMELAVWLRVLRPRVPFRPRRAWLLVYLTPALLLRAMAIAFVVTLVMDLVFRALVRPMMVRWYHPTNRGEAGSHGIHFLLEAGETVEQEVPARRVLGRSKQRGTLVRTSRRVYFEPFGWDQEAWSLPRSRVVQARAETPRRRVLGWVTGYPDHVVVEGDRGESATFVTADPAEVLVWFLGLEKRGEERPSSREWRWEQPETRS